MKTFPSNASRFRIFVRALHIGGWGCFALAIIFLGWVLFTHRANAPESLGLPTPTPRTTPASRPEFIAVLASRSLRQDVKPPTPIASVAPVIQQVHPPDVEVVATIVNPGEIPSAYIRSGVTKKLVSIRPGGQIDGATVKSITEGQVILELQGQEFPVQVGKKGS